MEQQAKEMVGRIASAVYDLKNQKQEWLPDEVRHTPAFTPEVDRSGPGYEAAKKEIEALIPGPRGEEVLAEVLHLIDEPLKENNIFLGSKWPIDHPKWKEAENVILQAMAGK